MSNLKARIGAVAAAAGFGLAFAADASPAAVLGPQAEACAPGSGRAAMLVQIAGLHRQGGLLRVQAYGGDPQRYFEKGSYIERIDVPLPVKGPVEVCLPVPHAGAYAVSVKHDVTGDGGWSLADGGGFSGNPKVSPMDALLKRKPSADKVQVAVRGVVHVPVTMRYLSNSL
jgi:uncharacterized protein (DUF2141 family)